MASLDGPRAREDVTRQDFVAWVDRYLRPGSPLECTALELYGARCALLHTYGSESALSRAGKIRQILHARGARAPIDLAATLFVTRPDDYVVVFLSELRAAFRQAVERFDSALATDTEKLKMIGERIETHWAKRLY